MNSYAFTASFSLIIGLVVGIFISVYISKAKRDAETQSANERLAEKNATILKIEQQLEAERKSAAEARILHSQEVDNLQMRFREASEAKAKLDGVQENLIETKRQVEIKSQNIEQLNLKITELSSQLSEAITSAEAAEKSKQEAISAKNFETERILEAKDKSIDEQRKILSEAELKLTDTFKALSGDALKSASDEFLKTAKATLEAAKMEAKGDLSQKQQAIDELLKPVAESLSKMEKLQKEMEEKRVSAFDSIEKGIENLSKGTDQLANALRKPASRGAWGEVILKTTLDNAGLVEGEHYTMQHNTEDEDGKKHRPDAIIHLPHGRSFIIDSKAPLESFWEGQNEEDPKKKEALFKKHSELVKNHVKSLSGKAYQNQYPTSPDCVVMFIPTEGAYQAAITADSSLLSEAHRQKIYLANPMTLISIVQIAAFVLHEDRGRKNALEIQETAAELYKRLEKFVESFAKVGKNIGLTVGSYNDAVGTLNSRILTKSNEMNLLGGGKSGAIATPTVIEQTVRELKNQNEIELIPSLEQGAPLVSKSN